MVALADVRRWDAARTESAFTALGAARDRLLDLDAELVGSRPPESWRGDAAGLARAEQERLAERLRRVTAGVAALRPSVAETADAVLGLRRDIEHADALAAARGFHIAPDGTVTDVRQTVVPLDQADAHIRRRTAEQAEILAILDGVLRRAAEIDRALADLLTRAATGQVDDGTGASLLGAAVTGLSAAVLTLPGPPATGTPADNDRWWDGLSAVEQERVVAEHPGWVGNRDGIPAAVRDDANRALLRTETARLDRELADATARWQTALDVPLPPGMEGQGETREQLALRGEVERLQEQRTAIGAVATTLDEGQDRHLLFLDVSSGAEPRAAVAVGDVDTADHVAVFTPGFTTTVAGSLGNYTDDMAGVRDTAHAQLFRAGRGDESVATVAWLGYDAPQWDTVGDPDRSVATDAAAQRGGADLARFLDGVDASRDTDPHLTALGHSYGSTTTGHALQQATGVDDAVLFGSPGASTGAVADLRVPPGHVGVLEARRDAVADLGSFGGDTNQLDGVTNLSAREETGPDGTPLRESVGHSDYLAPGTTSHHNIASTVAGLHDQRITGDNDGLGDVLRWGWDAF